MQLIIEVTEKEAMEIYEQRYISQHKKCPLIVMVVSVIVAIIVFVFITYYANSWLALTALALMFPAMYMGLKFSRASGKYARSQIEGQK